MPEGKTPRIAPAAGVDDTPPCRTTEPATVLAPIGLADLLAELGDWAARVEAAGVVLDATSALHGLEAARRLHGNQLGTGADAVRG